MASKPTPAETRAAAMIDAAGALIAGLSPDQRERATWPFPADDERTQWFYTPTDHGGLALSEMDSVQHRLVHQLLASALSDAGYATAAIILGQENILDHLEGFTVDFGRQRGRDPMLYWIAIFGQPAMDGAWSWRFGGHHLSLHFTMIDGRVQSTTPCFMGADPASTPLLGPHLHRPLGGAEDLGRELARSLNGSQATKALVSPAPPVDIVGSNRARLTEGDLPLPLPEIWRGTFEGDIDRVLREMDRTTADGLGLEQHNLEAVRFSTSPKGLQASALLPEQQEILRALLATYVGRIHDDLADQQLSKFAGDGLNELHFLWAGGLEVGDPHYYRVQGSELVVEYDNAQRRGNHVHTVWRDLSNDFGADPLAQHYAESH
ncbi:MAG: DUF3500 domain-containing protein [Acidimicrobiales bacterium]